MEAVGSRLGRASSRYGAPTVFSGPVRKWKKKWVNVSSPTSSPFHNSNSHNTTTNNNTTNNNASSRLLLRRWTPITAPTATADDPDNSSAAVSDEPPRRKFRYTPIAVLEEQKKTVMEKAEYEPITESDQLTARQKNVTHEMLNINEISEETKDSNITQLDLGLGFQGNNGENSQNGDDQFEKKYLVGGP